jgi:hypothetical protein
MLEKTQAKLDEVRFFWRLLVESREQPLRHEPGAFSYYLSAFLSAGRSVPWRMQAEEKAKYDAWLPAWESTLTSEKRELLRVTNKLRIDEVHRRGVETIRELEEIDFYEMLAKAMTQHHPTHDGSSSAQPGFLPVTARIPAYYLDTENGRAEVTAVCRQYLKYLEKLVQDFLSAHVT